MEEEIEVPKYVRPIMMEDAKETILGDRRGARKQYRYGNLHIREYNDKYIVHLDKIDPRKDPLGHLIIDSPDKLIGIASCIWIGKKVGSGVFNKSKGRKKNVLLESLLMGSLTSIILGFIGYNIGQKIKKQVI